MLFFLLFFYLTKLSNESSIQNRQNDVNIRELLSLSGQNPNQFTRSGYGYSNSYPELTNQYPNIDYDSNLYKEIISKPFRPPKNSDDLIMQEKTIDNLLGFVKGVVLCGGDGWCGNRCCTVNLNSNPQVQHRPANFRRKQKMCYPVCQPYCTPKCIEAARILMETTKGDTFKLSSGMPTDKDSLVASIPLCRPACMPACRESCLKKKQRPMKVTCRPACMPDCTPTCVASPPLMVPCMTGADKTCTCAPGYVQCSQFTCCMRYRTMAVRYRKLLPGYLYADNSTVSTSPTTTQPTEGLLSAANLNETLQTAGNLFSSFTSLLKPGNQTTFLSNALKSMNSSFSVNDNSVDYEVIYDYDENVDAGKPEFDAITMIP